MKEMICKNCGYKNKPGVRYCQRCGQYIKPKWTLAQEIKSWDFRGLAGVGRRDVNVWSMVLSKLRNIECFFGTILQKLRESSMKKHHRLPGCYE